MPGKINRTRVLHKSRGFHSKLIAPRLSKSTITQKTSTSCLLKQSSVCFLKPRQNPPSFKIVSSNHVTKCKRNTQNKKLTEANKSAQAKGTTHHHPKAIKPSVANTKQVRDASDKRVLEEVSEDGLISFPSGLSRLSTIASFIRAHSKQYKSFDQSEDTLVIGGDLLISKATDFSSENLYSYNLIQADIQAKVAKQTSLSRDSVTIEQISYKCEVLREHSTECPCSTPRLHVYLTANHRCSDTCSLSRGTGSGARQVGLTTTTNRGDGSTLTWSRHLLPLNMSGRIRSKTKSRSTPLISEFSGKMHCDWLSSTKMTNTGRLEEPESELLMEDEGESLPTIMHTLSGGVEYIVLDDETLNLTKDVSPDALKSKIDTILEDIDEKPDARETKESHINNSDVDKREPDSNCTAPLNDFTRVSDVIKKEDEIEIKTEPLAGCSSLAGACTNHSPSIKDIFGDVSIKEEPLEMGSNNDMSVDDFSKEINKISNTDQTTIVSDPKEGKSKGEYEEWNNGLFARLIKEETNMDDDVDIDTHGSDDSLGPLQIDESEPVYGSDDVQPRDFTANGQMPIVNIISPFKIKILLGNTRQEALQLSPSDPLGNLANASSSVKAAGKGGKKNGIAGARKGRKSPKKATVNKEVETKAPVAIENSGASAIKSFKCFYCQVESPNVQALAKHFDDHQRDGLIICYFCQKSFGDKTGLKRHMRTHTGEKPYQCKICGKRFSLPGNFKKHRDIHEDRRTEPCEVCGKTFRRKEHLKYHMRTHTGEKPYTCSECGTSFTARYSLQIHMNIHLGKKPYKCTYCSKAFSDKSTMRKHVRVHTGEKPFTCELCGRCFGESGTLAAHMATHRSERPFKCDKCQLSFKTSGGLRQHEKIHTGEKQFACRFCGMKFLMKYNMTMHERIHTGEKPYTCNHCDRSFRSRSCLAKHVVLHGGEEERRYHCDHCSSKFYRKAHLRRHIDMHLGIKNYECEKCKKKFCTKGTLRSHLKTFHSNGARRFPCNECGRVFKRKIYVTTHVCLKYPVIKNETPEGSSEVSSAAHPSTLASDSDQSSFEIVKGELEDEFMEDDDEDDDSDDSDDLDDDDDDEEDDEDEEFEDEEEEIEERGLGIEVGDL